jgi:PAS domain-containing protein
VDDSEEQRLYRDFVAAWTRYEETLVLVRSPSGAGVRRPTFDAAADSFRQALRAMDALFAFSRREGTAAALEVHAIYQSFSVMIVGVIGLGALILGTGVFWIARYVTQPILNMSEAMRRLAVGDPSAAVSEDGNRKDEIGTLIAAAAGYRESLVRSQDLAREAERQRYRLDAAVRNMPIGLTMFDSEKRLIAANSRYAEMYRLPERLMQPGTPLRDILSHRIGAGSYGGSSAEAWVEDILSLIDRRETLHDIRQFRDGRIFSIIHQPGCPPTRT